MARRRGPPDSCQATVAEIIADEDVIFIPVKHYSSAVASLVERTILRVRPAAVLVEGPEDATELLPHLLDPRTQPPLAVLSSYVDKSNRFGQNGVLSAAPDVPARFRAWWPLVAYAPEYRAITTGQHVGAEVAFIDASLRAMIPLHHVPRQQAQQVVEDRELAESSYFRRLSERTETKDFEDFWQATFEGPGLRPEAEGLREALLTFAWCVRASASTESLDSDGTIVREQHMRWHIDQARKRHPEGPIVVVVGAFHAVALPWTRPKRAARADASTSTLLCAHSYRALARLYSMNRHPAWGHTLWNQHRSGSGQPADDAARELILRTLRAARARGVVASTGDAIGAWTFARNLATVRGHGQVTPGDLADAVQAAFVKGDAATFGPPVAAALAEVWVGEEVGFIDEDAGRPPLVDDFYREARRHRLDVTGAQKTVKCHIGREPKHRDKSAFLHRCVALAVPLFAPLEGRHGTFFRGPDLEAGTDLELLGETWGVRWTEEVDDRLLELSGDGDSLEEAAAAQATEALEEARGDVERLAALLVRVSRTHLTGAVGPTIEALSDASMQEGSFDRLVDGLQACLMLFAYRDALPTHGDPRLLRAVGSLYRGACLRLEQLVRVDDGALPVALQRVQVLVRASLLGDGTDADPPVDADLLATQLQRLLTLPDVPPAIRGAACGVLYGLGNLGESDIRAELHSLVGGPRVDSVGAYLDGLFLTCRSVMLGSDHLLRMVHRVVVDLPQDAFDRALPDLRRAFTRFIPSELQELGQSVAGLIETGTAWADESPPDPKSIETFTALELRIEEILSRSN